MLIDTNQIIQLTDLRSRLSEIIDAVYQGKSFIITEKGKIKARIIPTLEKSNDVFDRIEKIATRIDKHLKKKTKVWNSVDLIRKMRQNRTKHLLKLSGITYKK
ncbi:hypothetical protein A2767_02015 [Candidatus Roizmanbacteria bacterium RIFCSPHIGHO2_01_FULL_35_10]|uniref:Antitoxin n=1 Tax=Candidatus Roizmanbacteria bacterium RIFCSPLOWO2_01_FULL_35_13 TaxID=1802055 RepID=A0A1F7I798_9BACT|nr:MAG: hypothetical protein A2767_02015 [Candidatus Roizmanbacteria bacterium RIFCSPHIGHO2_01_FULL_35_10]OGK39236.1 MAG: hypothetical protein A3A74_07430 [Candidatus Roizmanbacteria bacterium RIFCSPLOWO2_01_FULL_35_13]